MDSTAIAMQQLAVQRLASQGANGVVGNIGGETAFGNSVQGENGGFVSLLQTMMQINASAGKSGATAQLLLKEGEQNAGVIAAEMLMQNPFLMQLFMQNGFDMQQAQQMLAQAVEKSGILGGSGAEQAQTVANALMLMQQSGQETALTQPAQAFSQAVAMLQAASQKQTAGSQQAQNDTVNTQQSINAAVNTAELQILTPNSQKQAQPQAARLFEQSSVENAASRARVNTVSVNAGGESAKAENKGEGGEELSKNGAGEVNAAAEGKAKQKTEADGAAANAVQYTGRIENTITKAEQSAQPEAIDAKEVLNQTAQGIKQNIALGESDFVMRLNPEGLGEITVKLENRDGKITLQLTAQNQNVQKLLTNELDALRQAVKPYNVEVREVGGGANAGNDTSFSAQSNAQQQQQQQQQQLYNMMNGRFADGGYRDRTASFESILNGDEQEAIEIVPQAKVPLSSAIDTYI